MASDRKGRTAGRPSTPRQTNSPEPNQAGQGTGAPHVPLPSPAVCILTLAAGAMAALAVLAVLGFGPAEIWGSFAPYREVNGGMEPGRGGQFFRGLALSALVCGPAVAAMARHSPTTWPVASCALGWAVAGFLPHVQAPGSFWSHLPAGVTNREATAIFFSNGPSQALAVAFGLVLAGTSHWAMRQLLLRHAGVAESVSPEAGNGDFQGQRLAFSNAMSYPMVICVLGLGLMLAGGFVVTPSGNPASAELPSPPLPAATSALVVGMAFLMAGWVTKRLFRTVGTAGYAVAGPLVVAFVTGMFLASGGQFPLLQPAALLLWHSSPFEASVWAASGSLAGYELAGLKAVSPTKAAPAPGAKNRSK